MTNFSRVALIVKSDDESAANTLNDVIRCLERHSLAIVLDESTQHLVQNRATSPIEEIASNCDLAIVIGGDGTLLGAARELGPSNVPMVGINRGRLGFLADVSPGAALSSLESILNGEYIEEMRVMLHTRVLRDGECVANSYAFNDTVIRVRDRLQIMDYDIIIDDALVTHQRSDGLIVATPTGSTAYSLSNGGPIVAPTIDALIVHPICPHTLTSRPLIIEGESRIRVHLWDDDVVAAQVVCDGQVYMDAMMGDMVYIQRSSERLRMLHPEDYDYHRILREKLNWA